MSYANFKPTIWSHFIQTELEKKCKLIDDCNRQFEGEARLGRRVKILGAAAPEIFDYDAAAGMSDPETLDGTSVFLDIDQAKAFNFMVDDLDKLQAVPELMPVVLEEAGRKMAAARDRFIASLAQGASHFTASTKVSTAAEAKKLVDSALLTLRENDVDIGDQVSITVSPFFYQLLRDALTELKTNNDELIAKGIVGMYDCARVILSNNLYNDGTDDYMLVRTNKAIAFASAIDETEAYRPEKYFSDAIKGLNVYGGRLVRPKELVVIKAHK
ncbi:MAG: hypothetical protein DBX52_00300 [Clostridiales bacterium]|nr:MAG: hypothetical protein DBX52_00300 [Clostridiales bacterium]